MNVACLTAGRGIKYKYLAAIIRARNNILQEIQYCHLRLFFPHEHRFKSCLSLLHNHSIDIEILFNRRPTEEIARRRLYSFGALFVVF